MHATKGIITRTIESILSGFTGIKSLCDLEDFGNKLTVLKQDSDKSDQFSKPRELLDMFDIRSV